VTSTFSLDLEAALADLASARADLVRSVEALPPDGLERARRGGWSVRRILEHVIESEWMYAQAAAYLCGGGAPERGPADCAGQPVDEIICMLDSSRRALLKAIDGVSEDAFYEIKRLGREEYSALSLLENVAAHDREHAAQVRAAVGAV